jgi:hypothetical protein
VAALSTQGKADGPVWRLVDKFLLRIAMYGGSEIFHLLALTFELSDDLTGSHRGMLKMC